MKRALGTLDKRLLRIRPPTIVALAVCAIVAVGAIDYWTGYEVSVSLFYLVPVGLAAWYAGRGPAIAVAVLSCISWYFAEWASDATYSHPAIPVWNALIRLGYFCITGVLLAALRRSLVAQQQLARTDALTTLWGRRAFDDRLEHDLTLGRRLGTALSLAYLDLDGFKAVNDDHGHAEGDRVLRLIGEVLKRTVRDADTAARVGGDEFGLILPETNERGAREAVYKVAREIGDTLRASGFRVTCSIGCITFARSAVSPQRAIVAVDALMYEVKRKRKGGVAFDVVDERANADGTTDAANAEWHRSSREGRR